jgi:hypothetical protein
MGTVGSYRQRPSERRRSDGTAPSEQRGPEDKLASKVGPNDFCAETGGCRTVSSRNLERDTGEPNSRTI